MMILTNGLTDTVDEGFIKVANSLIERLKKSHSDIEVVSYERRSPLTDTFLELNKLMISGTLRKLCRKHSDVLYVPFPTRKAVMALRVFLLSRYTGRLRVVLVLRTPIGAVSRFFLKISGAEIVVFSKDAADFYKSIVGNDRVTYLRTGVDTKRFHPVSAEQAGRLKEKYGFDPKKKIVLHVGHLNEGRNIRELMKIDEVYQVLLVTSTRTKAEQDMALKAQLLNKTNIRIIEDYLPDIREIYQMSDVYFFPVKEYGHCIDVPLSCLEAAACGKPVITTAYGEMRQMIGKEGIYLLNDFSRASIHKAITSALEAPHPSGYVAAEYDWHHAASYLYWN